jgi:P-type Mg2+ transporter
MIAISVIVRFWQEYKSNVAAIKLQESVSSTISVRRQVEGKASDTTTEEKNLVPGDIVLLSAGDSVPADCLVLEPGTLQISQSR